MSWFRNVGLGLLTLSAVLAGGQTAEEKAQTPAEQPTTQRSAAVSASEQKPGSQIEKLVRALEGTWSIKEDLAPDSTSPNGSTGKGRIVWRSGPGGFSVIEDYQSKQGAQDVTGMGVFWWDDSARGYRTIWCDSTNPGGCISFKNVMRWDGSRLELVEDYEVNGKKLTFKEIFDHISPSTFTQTLYGGETGKELKIDQTIEATRLTSGTAR
jgi:hypothetical protein